VRGRTEGRKHKAKKQKGGRLVTKADPKKKEFPSGSCESPEMRREKGGSNMRGEEGEVMVRGGRTQVLLSQQGGKSLGCTDPQKGGSQWKLEKEP